MLQATVVTNCKIVIFLSKFVETIEDRQHSVILLVNDRSNPLVCHKLSRFCKLKFVGKI